MEVIKHEIECNMDECANLNRKTCFFDIETSGLNRDIDVIYLVGILYYNDERNKLKLIQLFANDLKDEPKVLSEAIKLLSQFNLIVNYNGNAFDIPFLNHRARLNGLEGYVSRERSLDIYATIRKNKYIFELENLKLKTIEKYLGIERSDMYSGKDCIQFYRDYLIGARNSLKEKILQHNYDDLYYLPQVMKILNIIDDKKTFEILDREKSHYFTIKNIKQTNDYLIVDGKIKNRLKNILTYYGTNYKILIDGNKFLFELETLEGLVSPKEKCLFIYKEDYNLFDSYKKLGYAIADNVILLAIKKKYLVDNIMKVLKSLIMDVVLKIN